MFLTEACLNLPKRDFRLTNEPCTTGITNILVDVAPPFWEKIRGSLEKNRGEE